MSPALRRHANAAIELAVAASFRDLRLDPVLAKRLVAETRAYLAKTPNCRRLFLINQPNSDGKPYLRIRNKLAISHDLVACLDIERWRNEWVMGLRADLASVPVASLRN